MLLMNSYVKKAAGLSLLLSRTGILTQRLEFFTYTLASLVAETDKTWQINITYAKQKGDLQPSVLQHAAITDYSLIHSTVLVFTATPSVFKVHWHNRTL